MRSYSLAGMRLPLAVSVLALVAGCESDPLSPVAEAPVQSAEGTGSRTLLFRQLSLWTNSCGVTTADEVFCWGGTPTPVAAGRRFQEVRVGVDFMCGLTPDQLVYCWGRNTEGQLGDGSNTAWSAEPVQVAGGRRYRFLRVGRGHACAITSADVTYCWGLNDEGQLGDGTRTTRRVPVRVAGGNAFRLVSTGSTHTCAIARTTNKAFCWGHNASGQIGNRSPLTNILTPVGVSDGRTFNVVSAGHYYNCGVTTANQAYCWGENVIGQLGDGTLNRRSRPTAVAGGISFSGVNAGVSHTCGVTTAKVAYCWGYNQSGQLGDGTEQNHKLTPVPVAGGHLFKSIYTSPLAHTCAVRIDDRAFCWGANTFGQLGDGTTVSHRTTPTPVADAAS